MQVIEGGNYDVDVSISSGHKTLYEEQKKQYDQHTWTTDNDGEYHFCFSNEFSTVTHKVIYFDFQAGDDDPLHQPSRSPLTAMTQVYMRLFRHIFFSSSMMSWLPQITLSGFLHCSQVLIERKLCITPVTRTRPQKAKNGFLKSPNQRILLGLLWVFWTGIAGFVH